MKLRGIDFGSCWVASGTRGFFGEGYWFHRLPLLNDTWYDWSGTTFVAKSTTLQPKTGNMPIDPSFPFRPKHFNPECIWVSWNKRMALNAVGLSGPGADPILYWGMGMGEWEKLKGPFQISFAPEGKTPKERLADVGGFVSKLGPLLIHHSKFVKMMGFQINVSCPNTGVDTAELADEAILYLDEAAQLGIPIILKINLLVPLKAIAKFAAHPACDAISLANTIPFGQLPEQIPWKKWFPKGSPLAQFGGGGLSGEPLLFLVAERVQQIRNAGIHTPLNVGGGILESDDVNILVESGLDHGRDSVSLGSIAMLAPWNIQETISRAHKLLG